MCLCSTHLLHFQSSVWNIYCLVCSNNVAQVGNHCCKRLTQQNLFSPQLPWIFQYIIYRLLMILFYPCDLKHFSIYCTHVLPGFVKIYLNALNVCSIAYVVYLQYFSALHL